MKIDFQKFADGLVPAIIQDARTQRVLMLGYMNTEALDQTRSTGKVTLFSRSRDRIWVKGETSGNFLKVETIKEDCDQDTILITATPAGPVCHTGADTCFGEDNKTDNFLKELEATIRSRRITPSETSYTTRLFAEGINKIAQKVGEEAVELIIEAKDNDQDRFKGEAADLIYHLLVLLAAKDLRFDDVVETLRQRK